MILKQSVSLAQQQREDQHKKVSKNKRTRDFVRRFSAMPQSKQATSRKN